QFVAPLTGIYSFSGSVQLTGLVVGTHRVQISIATNPRFYQLVNFIATATDGTFTFAVEAADMTAGNFAPVQGTVAGGAKNCGRSRRRRHVIGDVLYRPAHRLIARPANGKVFGIGPVAGNGCGAGLGKLNNAVVKNEALAGGKREPGEHGARHIKGAVFRI